jgi:hypothetical protein
MLEITQPVSVRSRDLLHRIESQSSMRGTRLTSSLSCFANHTLIFCLFAAMRYINLERFPIPSYPIPSKDNVNRDKRRSSPSLTDSYHMCNVNPSNERLTLLRDMTQLCRVGYGLTTLQVCEACSRACNYLHRRGQPQCASLFGRPHVMYMSNVNWTCCMPNTSLVIAKKPTGGGGAEDDDKRQWIARQVSLLDGLDQTTRLSEVAFIQSTSFEIYSRSNIVPASKYRTSSL